MKNCPNCNRTLVEGPDHSLKCIFCGWSALAEVAQAEQEEEKIKQTAEEIARQRIKEETSKTPQIVMAVIAVLGVIIFILTNFVFKGEDKPKETLPSSVPTPIVMPTPTASIQSESPPQVEPTPEASTEPSIEPTPEASPSENPNVLSSVSPTASPSTTGDVKESASVTPDAKASSDKVIEATPEASPS